MPLPIAPELRDINKAYLPPFLPEEVPLDIEEPTIATSIESEEVDSNEAHGAKMASSGRFQNASKSSSMELPRTNRLYQSLPVQYQKHLGHWQDVATRPQTWGHRWNDFVRGIGHRRMKSMRLHRTAIYDELLALQRFKQQLQRKGGNVNGNTNNNRQQREGRRNNANGNGGNGGGRILWQRSAGTNDRGKAMKASVGYALVTGASQGIGRALAVELARWQIPLLLVARDKEKLLSLATDLESCYGIDCCVVPADLSKPRSARKIYEATKAARIDVDILVNNAGVSMSGDFVENDESFLSSLLNINVMAVTKLSRLYGADMKRRGRGRILMVSSIMGDVASGPSVAAYAASKCFEKSLALSMSKELEPHGVGVTCLMPGAVSSQFRYHSGSADALCWKIPFYVKRPETVASTAVRAMLRGDQESMPGWGNRFFSKIVRPVLPERLVTVIVETAWNPLQYTIAKMSHLKPNRIMDDDSRDNAAKDTDRDRQGFFPSLPKKSPRVLSVPMYDDGDDDDDDGDAEGDDTNGQYAENLNQNGDGVQVLDQDTPSEVTKSDANGMDEGDVMENEIHHKEATRVQPKSEQTDGSKADPSDVRVEGE